MYRKTIIIALLMISLLTGCWKKQKHEITAPETPVYNVTGTIIDIDSNEIMPGVVVIIFPIDMIYDYDFVSATDTTNAQGEFEFKEITPGSYQIQCFRNSFAVLDENLVVDHGDKETEIALPTPIVARTTYGPPQYPGLQGIAWKNSDTFAGVGIFQEHSDDLAQNVVIAGNFQNGFSTVGSARYTRDNPSFYAVTYLGRYWTTDGSESKTKLWSIDNAKGNIDGETIVEFGLRDLTADKHNLWATTSLRKIVKFGEHPSKVEQIFEVDASQPYGIAWSKSGMWISDLQDNLLLHLDNDLSIKASYRAFGWTELQGVFQLSNLRYLAFDAAGDLWANDGVNTYKFKLD
jgi:hypothetical protein